MKTIIALVCMGFTTGVSILIALLKFQKNSRTKSATKKSNTLSQKYKENRAKDTRTTEEVFNRKPLD